MTDNDIATVEIIVSGRVQGVYFRKSALGFAKSLRLKGNVQNLKDGNVKIIAQGPRKNIEEFLQWSHRGSLLTKVDGMSYRWVEAEANFSDFVVIKDENFIVDQARSFFNLGKRISNKLEVLTSDVKVPKHVVIIPDGNRRWAKQHGLQPWKAYWYVQNKITELVEGAKKFDIDNLTVWGFSTENWKRDDQTEIEQLMKVFDSTIDKFKDQFHKEEVRFRHLGRKDRLPAKLIEKFTKFEQETKNYTKRSLNIAIDYGGRDELLRAIDGIIKSGKTEVTEDDLSAFLDTQGLPDPDLIIRTSGEKRLSGLMPWQSVYSEFYFTNVLFPDFSLENFREAILEYSSRKRKFGGDDKKIENVSENNAVVSNLQLSGLPI